VFASIWVVDLEPAECIRQNGVSVVVWQGQYASDIMAVRGPFGRLRNGDESWWEHREECAEPL
jgi:hypothetical protein